jgi:hypothetical protein
MFCTYVCRYAFLGAIDWSVGWLDGGKAKFKSLHFMGVFEQFMCLFS